MTKPGAIRDFVNCIKVSFTASCKQESVQPYAHGTQKQVQSLLAPRACCSALLGLASWLLVLRGSRSHQPYPPN